MVRARIEELKTEKTAAQASLPKLTLATKRTDPATLLDQVPDLSERLRNADDATKRALFDAFDLRVVYDKASDRLSISGHADRSRSRHAPHRPRAVVTAGTPGVGLEPTTSRLTVERICQIELPRTELPRKGSRRLAVYVSDRAPAPTSAWQLAQSSTHLRASARAFSSDLATPRLLISKLFSSGTRWWNSSAATQRS